MGERSRDVLDWSYVSDGPLRSPLISDRVGLGLGPASPSPSTLWDRLASVANSLGSGRAGTHSRVLGAPRFASALPASWRTGEEARRPRPLLFAVSARVR